MERAFNIRDRIDELKNNYSAFRTMQNYHVFTALCIKYFYFSDEGSFDPDEIASYITDGSYDGGIDAVFNDPENPNDAVIVQSKFYDESTLTRDDIVAELLKIEDTVNRINNRQLNGLNDNTVSRYRDAIDGMQDGGQIRVIFFTSYAPRNNKERNSIEKYLLKHFKSFELEIKFCEDIREQIETIETAENVRPYVERGILKIDRKDNCLKYDNSVIVNVSAGSLQDLFVKHRNSLLGMNLRYFKNKSKVDKDVNEGINNSIERQPENFWYKNNGIIIVCRDFKIDGTDLELHDFSIVNGGQTTNRIGKNDIQDDFFLQCKVVKIKGDSLEEQDRFAHEIAEASNAQKPINHEDLVSNKPEQIRLRERLSNRGVYYITKQGDVAPRKFAEKYQKPGIGTVGKVSIAAALLMPGSARSNARKIMYLDEYYDSIFGSDAREGVIADALKIDFYYDKFKRKDSDLIARGFDRSSDIPMIKNGKTFQLACISFLCKIKHGVFSYDEINNIKNDHNILRATLRKMGNMTQIISLSSNEQVLQELLIDIFSIIGREVLGQCLRDAQYRASSSSEQQPDASNYLKQDTMFYKDVIGRLWYVFKNNNNLKDSIDSLFGPQ